MLDEDIHAAAPSVALTMQLSILGKDALPSTTTVWFLPLSFLKFTTQGYDSTATRAAFRRHLSKAIASRTRMSRK